MKSLFFSIKVPFKPELDHKYQKNLMNVVFNPLLTYFPPFFLRNSATFEFQASVNGVSPCLFFALISAF